MYVKEIIAVLLSGGFGVYAALILLGVGLVGAGPGGLQRTVAKLIFFAVILGLSVGVIGKRWLKIVMGAALLPLCGVSGLFVLGALEKDPHAIFGAFLPIAVGVAFSLAALLGVRLGVK